jgi:phosphoribosyl-ATP pyrophosphohydrolase/phosphoribosyl-AMP cyclohydrolase
VRKKKPTEARWASPEPDWSKGLVPAIAQECRTGRVLMVAFVDRKAWAATLKTGYMHYYSRSRGRLWKKGEESGNVQKVISLHLDCDGDAVLARVEQLGPACHLHTPSCFLGAAPLDEELEELVKSRAEERPAGSHVVRLLDDENLRLKKIAEEAAELIMALQKGDKDRAREEAADLYFHMLVGLNAAGVAVRDVRRTLLERRRKAASGGRESPDRGRQAQSRSRSATASRVRSRTTMSQAGRRTSSG